MRYTLFNFLFILITAHVSAQNFSGQVVDAKTNQPLEGVSINISPNNTTTITDARGNFIFKTQQLAGETVTINNIGYASQNISMATLQKLTTIALTQQQIQLHATSVALH